MEKNLSSYLRKHPECEIYEGQDKQKHAMDNVLLAVQIGMLPSTQPPPSDWLSGAAAERRVTIWNKRDARKISGNAAPLQKNLWHYLRDHPECEVYSSQDKSPDVKETNGHMKEEPIPSATEEQACTGLDLLAAFSSTLCQEDKDDTEDRGTEAREEVAKLRGVKRSSRDFDCEGEPDAERRTVTE